MSKIYLKPCLVAIVGQSGVGKTTLCRELTKQTNFYYFDIEDTKRNLINSTLAPHIRTIGYDPSVRLPSHLERLVMRATYALNHTLAGLNLENRKPVLVSAPYSHSSYQIMLREVSEVTNKPLVVISLHTDEQTLNQRISSRPTDPNNISAITDLTTASQLRSSYSYITGPEVHDLESNQTPSQLAQQVISILTAQDLISSKDN